MRKVVAVGIAAGLVAAAASGVLAQQAPPPPPGIERVAPRPPGGPQPDAAMVARGNATYLQTCAVCHGPQGRGGPFNSPDVTLSAIAMAADGGRELHQFLQVGRPDKGMPPFPLSEADAIDLSAKLRSLGFAAAPPPAPAAAAPGPAGAPPARPAAPTDVVLVGDAAAGKRYFEGPVGQCGTCHAVAEGQASSARNLWNISAKYPDPRVLQNNMVLNRTFFWSPATSKDVTATISYRNGRTLSGYLSSASDFKVIIRDEAGQETTMVRRDGEPKVVLKDRLQHHLDLLPKYRDSDIHDLTAYLVSLK